jgi:hypothetical protein
VVIDDVFEIVVEILSERECDSVNVCCTVDEADHDLDGGLVSVELMMGNAVNETNPVLVTERVAEYNMDVDLVVDGEGERLSELVPC